MPVHIRKLVGGFAKFVLVLFAALIPAALVASQSPTLGNIFLLGAILVAGYYASVIKSRARY